MDYAKIYRDFIADRRSRLVSGYGELHHILPKSLGGYDDPSNLIRLTPEDHYFAHLLLAKMYGGTQWTAVVMMGTSRAEGRKRWVRQRIMYGAARRRSAAALSIANAGQQPFRGAENGMYDCERHDWTNLDTGCRRTATKWEMWSEFGGCRAHWTSVPSGKRKSMLGWTTAPETIRIRSSKGKVFRFSNDNGEQFVGTQGAFARHCGTSIASASRLARGLVSSLSGWRALESNAA